MAFNAEVSAKATDKRVAALEKMVGGYEKQLRQVDYSALTKKLDGLGKTLDILEKKLATLEKITTAVAVSIKDPKKLLAPATQEFLSKDQIEKLQEASTKQEFEKVMKENKKFADNIAKTSQLEGRLKVIEAKLTSLGR